RRPSASPISSTGSSRFATSSTSCRHPPEPAMTNKPTPPKAPATRTPAQLAMQQAARPEPASTGPGPATMSDYLKEAFFFRWNLLFLVGGAAAAAITPLAPVLLPLVAAGELTYLTGLVSI